MIDYVDFSQFDHVEPLEIKPIPESWYERAKASQERLLKKYGVPGVPSGNKSLSDEAVERVRASMNVSTNSAMGMYRRKKRSV